MPTKHVWFFAKIERFQTCKTWKLKLEGLFLSSNAESTICSCDFLAGIAVRPSPTVSTSLWPRSSCTRPTLWLSDLSKVVEWLKHLNKCKDVFTGIGITGIQAESPSSNLCEMSNDAQRSRHSILYSRLNETEAYRNHSTINPPRHVARWRRWCHPWMRRWDWWKCWCCFLDPDIHGEAKQDSAEEHQNTKLTDQSTTRSRVQKKFARHCWRRVERSSWWLGNKDSMLQALTGVNVTSHCCMADWVGPGCRLKHVRFRMAKLKQSVEHHWGRCQLAHFGSRFAHLCQREEFGSPIHWMGWGWDDDELGELQHVCFSTLTHQVSLMSVLT